MVRGLLALDSAKRNAFARPSIYKDSTLPVSRRVSDLLAHMTLDEKFWQLYMTPGDLDNPAQDYSNGSFGLQIRMPASDSVPPNSSDDFAAAAVDGHGHLVPGAPAATWQSSNAGVTVSSTGHADIHADQSRLRHSGNGEDNGSELSQPVGDDARHKQRTLGFRQRIR